MKATFLPVYALAIALIWSILVWKEIPIGNKIYTEPGIVIFKASEKLGINYFDDCKDLKSFDSLICHSVIAALWAHYFSSFFWIIAIPLIIFVLTKYRLRKRKRNIVTIT
jgi:hypothetical protein